MFLGIAIFETLSSDGVLNSYIMSPSRKGASLIVDNFSDIDRQFSNSSVDVGPLRVYADRAGIGFRHIFSKLGGRSFDTNGNEIRLDLEHTDVPLEPNHAGYYGLLLPQDFLGDVALSIRVRGDEQVTRPTKTFITDSRQLFVSSDFRVYSDQRGSPRIRLNAHLVLDGNIPRDSERSTFTETFGGYIDGLHDESIASLIREINRSHDDHVSQAFICHSSADKEHARKLAVGLASRGVRVWIDEAEIHVGDSLIEKIESGIFSSRNLVVVMTPRSVSSRWCQEELRMALVRQIKGERIRVLPALFEDCEIPGFLIEKAYADFREPSHFGAGVDAVVSAIGRG